MDRISIEYPLGSGQRYDLAVNDYDSVEGGYRLSIGVKSFLDVAEGLSIWTGEAFVPASEMVGKCVYVITARTDSQFTPIVDWNNEPQTVRVYETYKYKVSAVEAITERRTAVAITADGDVRTADSEEEKYFCALTRDPCGDKFLIPVMIEHS
jgi:hypothetical protein